MVIRFFTRQDLLALVSLYRDCFAEAPWFEVFDAEELTLEFEEIFSWPDTIFLVGVVDGQIVGGAIGFSVSRKSDVIATIPKKFHEGFYISELFVDAKFRKRGIAKVFAAELRRLAIANGFCFGVVRTSVDQPIIQHMYVDVFGFKIVATQETVSTKVIDGIAQEAPDSRVIMAGSFPFKLDFCGH